MSETEKMAADKLSNEIIQIACEQQQCFYEFLSECTEYTPDEHKYLKRNIGFAIYGPPNNKIESTTENTTENTTESNNSSKSETFNDVNADIADTLDYGEEERSVIDEIYNKICECVIKEDNSQPIYCGIIYNVICPPINSEDQIKQQAEKKAQNEKEEETEKTDVKKENYFSITPIPIFTIRKNINEQSVFYFLSTTKTVKQKEKVSYDTWYIDTSARVYKSWSDYKENNKLPECIMVLPKDGYYQADENYVITEDYSTVLLEIEDSPACAWTAKLCNGIDIASAVVGLGGMGLCVASMFTPLAPVAIAGLAATGATGAWGLGRSSQQLADRSTHEESINLFNRQAFPHWIGIAGSVTGLGAIGGSAALSTAAARGMSINIVARTAFNTVQGSSIFINGVGVLYQGYCVIDKYRTENTFSYVDTLNFVMHAMFFASSVITIQFAGDIIESTQGRVVDDYRNSLRSKNLRKKFNRIRRRANENNTNSISENAEVIRYIRNRQQLSSVKPGATQGAIQQDRTQIKSDRTSFNVKWSFDHGKLMVNGIALIDPLEYVTNLVKMGIFTEADQNQFESQNSASDCMVERLMKVLCDLLNKFYVSNNHANNHANNLPNFEPLLKKMSSMNMDEEFVKMLFDIAVKLIERSRNMENFLLNAMTFVWQYCRTNLKQWNIITHLRMRSDSGTFILRKIIIAVNAAIEMILDNLFKAFIIYNQLCL